MTKLLLLTLIGRRGGNTLLKFIIFLHLDQDTKTLYPVLLCSNLALKSAGVSSLLQPISCYCMTINFQFNGLLRMACVHSNSDYIIILCKGWLLDSE